MSSKKPVSADEIRRLSQEEGLIDREIAEVIGCHRVTVSRIRLRDNIPRPNLANRKDKEQVCKRCGKSELIRRKTRLLKYCDDCRVIHVEECKEKKRLYMKDRHRKK